MCISHQVILNIAVVTNTPKYRNLLSQFSCPLSVGGGTSVVFLLGERWEWRLQSAEERGESR